MKYFRDSLIVMIVSVVVFCAGIFLLERHYKHELDKMGWLSKEKVNLYPFGRRISGYTVSENVPNFTYSVYDDNFKVFSEQTDSNGFKTDGRVVTRLKDSNTIRIFITGGSTAWGSIESRDIMKDATYPSGTYCFASTIAGKLKALLQVRYPQFKFEVIDAAVVKYRFHQSLALYYERLHDFNPDVIINIDGFNDIGNLLDFVHGDPYPLGLEKMEEELQLTAMARLPQWPYTLAFYNFKYVRQQGKTFDGGKTSVSRSLHNGKIIQHEPDYKAFETIKPYLKISKKMLWLIDSYERQLHADNVYSIFCLQPTIKRRVNQKELSQTELRFRTFLEKVTEDDTMKLSVGLKQSNEMSAFTDTISKYIGSDSYWLGNLIGSYMLNYCSPVFDSIVQSEGGEYLDVGKSMTGMARDKEFYVDYCHLTPFGNEYVAELLATRLNGFINRRAKNLRW